MNSMVTPLSAQLEPLCRQNLLWVAEAQEVGSSQSWDELPLGRGTIQEWSSTGGLPALTVPTMIAARLLGQSSCGYAFWIGQESWPTPQFLINQFLLNQWTEDPGALLRRCIFLRASAVPEIVLLAETCLRSPLSVSVIFALSRSSRVQTQRLSLAARAGGGIGFLLRTTDGRADDSSVASARFLSSPVSGSGTTPTWQVTLQHLKGAQSTVRRWYLSAVDGSGPTARS